MVDPENLPKERDARLVAFLLKSPFHSKSGKKVSLFHPVFLGFLGLPTSIIHTSPTPGPVFRCFKKTWKKHRNPKSMGISGCLKIRDSSNFPWKWFY